MVTTVVAATVLLGVLIFVHEMGHFIIAKISGVGVVKFSLGFGPKILSKKIGETEYLLSAIPLGGYVKMVGEEPDEELSEGDLSKSFTNKPVIKRAGIVLAGPLFNIIFAIFAFFVIHIVGVPILTTEVGDTVEDSPAFEAGIQKGDLITSINGKEISKWEELTEIIQQSKGAELFMNIKRDGRYYEVQLRPKPYVDKNIFGEEIETYKIGVNASDKTVTLRHNPFSAVLIGFQQTWWWTKLTGITIYKLIDRTVPAKSLGGPILIVQMAGQQAQAGLIYFLSFMAIISINLGIINLFPIPILDGGHLFFFLLEAIRGKPISIKKMEIAQQIGLVIIILLIIFVFYNDITR